MKCKNCGLDISDNTLICPRCGTRQNGNNNGNGNDGSGKNKNGFNGKIFVAVFTLIIISVLTIVLVKNVSNKKVSKFTHNTEFNKDRLSVADSDTLRYREVSDTKTFSVGSEKGFVEVEIKDENGNNANYIVNKTEKFDRYVIKPNDKWDNTHIYYMSLGNDTYFTDEDMYKFKNLIYTIKRPEVATYKYNDNIKNLIENPNEKVEVGDIIVFRDESGQSICKKVVSDSNGNIIYDTPDLAEVFEDLNLNTTIRPNFKDLFSNNEIKSELMNNFINSSLFEYFVMTTYADEIGNTDDWIKDGNYGLKIREQVADTKVVGDTGNTVTEQLIKNLEVGVDYGDLNFSRVWEIIPKYSATQDKIDIEINATCKAIDTEKKGNDKKEKGKEGALGDKTVTLKVSISRVECRPDIDIPNKKFDIQVYNTISINIKYNFEIKSTLVAKDEKDYEFKLFNLPLYSGIPVVHPYFKCSFVPEFGGNFEFTGSYNKVVANCYGMTLVGNDYVKDALSGPKYSDDDILEIKFSGEANAKASIKPELGIRFYLIPESEIKSYNKLPLFSWLDNLKQKIKDLTDIGHVGLYAKGGVFVELSGEFKGKLKPGSILDEDGSKNTKGSIGTELSIGAGFEYDIAAEGDLKIGVAKLSNTLEIVNGKVYLLNHNAKASISSLDKEVKNKLDIELDIGSTVTINSKQFIVLDHETVKNNDGEEVEKRALIILKDGFEAKYNNWSDNGTKLGASWKKSSLRDYLNGDYLNPYSDVFKTSLCKVKVEAQDSIPNGEFVVKAIDEDTKDQVFILSYNEYHKKNAVGREYLSYLEEESRDKYYWTRNPGRIEGMDVALMQGDKQFVPGGKNVTTENIYVRPAMWVRFWMKEEEVNPKLKGIENGIILDVKEAGDGYVYVGGYNIRKPTG